MLIAAALLLGAAGCLLPARACRAYTRALRVGVEYNRAPFQYLDETGRCAGLNIELMDAIAQQNGWKVEYVPYRSYMDCMKAMSANELDMILGFNPAYSIPPELSGSTQLSDVFSSTTICMITSRENAGAWSGTDDYRNSLGAFEYASVSYMYLSRWHLRQCYIKGNQASLVQALADGDVDVIFGSYDSLTYLLDNCYGAFRYTVMFSNITTLNYAVLVRGDKGDVLHALNNTLAEMRSRGMYDTIYNRWIVDKSQQNIRKIVIVFAALAATVLAAFCAISIINRVLKKKVREKTRELLVRMDQIGNESDFRNRIIEQSPCGMIYFRRDFAVDLANKAAKAICGQEDQTIVGRDIRMFRVFGEIIRRCDGALFDARAGEAEPPAGVIEIENRGWGMRTFRYSFSRNYQMDQVGGVLLTVDDITVQEKEKRDAIEAGKNKALNRIVAGIAHEIKNPLMAIRLYASLIRSQGGDQEFYDSFSEKVPREVERINSLVEALINYARPVRGEKERVDVARMIDDSVCLYRAAAGDMGIRLSACAQESLYIWASGDRIKQALINFITNGLESMEQKMKEEPCAVPPELRVRAWRSGDRVNISVRDEGTGMTPEEIELCSEPFYTTKAKGTGLGMALAKQFINDNDGKMTVRSEKGGFTEIVMQFQEVGE